MFEPMLVRWYPYKKSLVVKIVPWIFSILFYAFIFFAEFLKRLVVRGFRKADLIPFILPLLMMRYAPEGHALSTLLLWLSIVVNNKFYLKIAPILKFKKHLNQIFK